MFIDFYLSVYSNVCLLFLDESDSSTKNHLWQHENRKILSPSTSTKVILRQPRLQFPTFGGNKFSGGTDGPFSMNINTTGTSQSGVSSNTGICYCDYLVV